MSAYFVVNHVSDENKTDGLVESYQMVPWQYQDADGNVHTTMRRLNFVHWPSLPIPFVHQEWAEDLKFENVYVPENDSNENQSASNLVEETFDELTQEEWDNLPESVRNMFSVILSTEDEEDEIENEENEEVFESDEEEYDNNQFVD